VSIVHISVGSDCHWSHLGSDVVRCAAKGFGDFVSVDAFFAHAEVGDFDVTVLIQQDVVQLQVAVNDAPAVQEEQADGYFRRVETGDGAGIKAGQGRSNITIRK
jgi:hypothetical protein